MKSKPVITMVNTKIVNMMVKHLDSSLGLVEYIDEILKNANTQFRRTRLRLCDYFSGEIELTVYCVDYFIVYHTLAKIVIDIDDSSLTVTTNSVPFAIYCITCDTDNFVLTGGYYI